MKGSQSPPWRTDSYLAAIGLTCSIRWVESYFSSSSSALLVSSRFLENSFLSSDIWCWKWIMEYGSLSSRCWFI